MKCCSIPHLTPKTKNILGGKARKINVAMIHLFLWPQLLLLSTLQHFIASLTCHSLFLNFSRHCGREIILEAFFWGNLRPAYFTYCPKVYLLLMLKYTCIEVVLLLLFEANCSKLQLISCILESCSIYTNITCLEDIIILSYLGLFSMYCIVLFTVSLWEVYAGAYQIPALCF